MDTDDKILSENVYKLINKLMNVETKLYKKKEKYPNLHRAWHTALIYKINKMNDILDQCDHFCENAETVIENDIPVKTLALLYILNNNYK